MNDLRTAAQQALEALEEAATFHRNLPDQHARRLAAMTALRAALAEPVQEPVAWALSHSRGIEFSSRYPMQASKKAADQMARQHMGAVTVTPLYTAPPQRKPLTEQQIWDAVQHGVVGRIGMPSKAIDVARAIERAHGIGE